MFENCKTNYDSNRIDQIDIILSFKLEASSYEIVKQKLNLEEEIESNNNRRRPNRIKMSDGNDWMWAKSGRRETKINWSPHKQNNCWGEGAKKKQRRNNKYQIALGVVRFWCNGEAGEGDPPQRPHPTATLAASTSPLFGLSNANFATINRLYQRFISNCNCNCIPQDSFGAIERYAFYLLQLVTSSFCNFFQRRSYH